MLKLLATPVILLACILSYYIYSEGLALKEIKEYTNQVVIYSRPQCSYCSAAVEFLDSKNIPFEVIDITNDEVKINALVSETGSYTVPYIFINNQYVGGYNDMVKLFKAGKLYEMLK
jgi:glutaredoxin 3